MFEARIVIRFTSVFFTSVLFQRALSFQFSRDTLRDKEFVIDDISNGYKLNVIEISTTLLYWEPQISTGT